MYQELYFPVLDSSNAYAKDQADTLEDLTFIRAGFQSKGKGRGERAWLAKAGENLLFSLLIKRENLLQIGPKISLIAANCLAKTLLQHGVADVSIKWPNDVYIAGKKVCGILLEGSLPSYLVIGMGINVNQMEFAGEYRIAPTSIALSLGRTVDIEALKEELFSRLYFVLSGSIDFAKELAFFATHDYLRGKTISLLHNNKVIEGTASGVNEAFELQLENAEGTISLSGGEVHILRAK